MGYSRHILFAAFLTIRAWAGGCQAVQLKPGMAVSQDCKVFAKLTINGEQWIEYRGRREKIDCTKAKVDVPGGWHDYYAHIVDARFWCPALDHFEDKYAKPTAY